MALTEEQKKQREVPGVSAPRPAAALAAAPVSASEEVGGFWPGDAVVRMSPAARSGPAPAEPVLPIGGVATSEIPSRPASYLPIPAIEQFGPPKSGPVSPTPLLTNIGGNPRNAGEAFPANAAGVPRGFASQTDHEAWKAKNPIGGAAPAIDLRPGTRGYFEQTGLQPSMGQQLPGAAGPAFMAGSTGGMVSKYPASVRYSPQGGGGAIPLGEGGGPPSIRDQTMTLLRDKGPVNQSALQQILSSINGGISSYSGPREVMSYDPQREARMNADSRSIIGPNGRVSRSLTRLREQEMENAGAAARQESGSAASLKQALVLEALKLDAAGQSVESERIWQQALNQEKRDFESQSQDKDITSREKIAGMNVGQRGDKATSDADAKATAAEDRKTAINERRLAEREKEYNRAEREFKNNAMNAGKEWEGSSQEKRLSRLVQESLRAITGEPLLESVGDQTGIPTFEEALAAGKAKAAGGR